MLMEMESYGVGNTPLIELEPVNGNRVFVKLDKENKLGSIKSRTAYWIIRELPKEADNKCIIESTSGNLGLALGFMCKETNRRFRCLVDESIAKKKLEKLQQYGIDYEMVQGRQGLDLRSSRIIRAQELMDSGECFWVNQYDNMSGIKAHFMTTGPEIWEQTGHKITCCVAPMGSGGTICGLSRFFKEKSDDILICGVEPYGSTIFGEVDAPYINVGAGLVGKPGNLIRSGAVIDKHETVKDEESVAMAQKLYRDYGLAVGVTSGMAYAMVLKLASEMTRQSFVFIAPDGRESYEEYLY